jgi:hypothetical protein
MYSMTLRNLHRALPRCVFSSSSSLLLQRAGGKEIGEQRGKSRVEREIVDSLFSFFGGVLSFFFPLRKRLFERVSRPLSLAKHDISVGTVLLVCLVHTYSLISRGRERETERERERESDDHPKRPPPSMTGALPTNIHTLRTRVFQSRKTQTWGKSASSVSDCHS